MKPRRHQQREQQQPAGARRRPAPRGDDPVVAPAPAGSTKGCAAFWVGDWEQGEAPRRVAVPVARLGHPRMLELLGEARDEYGFAHRGAVVVPCAVDRFMRAVEEAASASASVGDSHGHHHLHFRLPLPHIHIARCFRPSHTHVVA